MLRRPILSLLLVGWGSAAAATVYTSQAAYLAADPQTTFVSFAGMTDMFRDAGAVTRMGGLTFSAVYPTFVSTNYWGSVDSYLDDKFNGTINLSFHNRVSAGFEYASSYFGDSPIDVTVYSHQILVYAATLWGGGVHTNFAFFGIDGVGDITGVTLDASRYDRSFASIADVSTGFEVPEPAMWALLVASFGLIGARRRAMRLEGDPRGE